MVHYNRLTRFRTILSTLIYGGSGMGSSTSEKNKNTIHYFKINKDDLKPFHLSERVFTY